MDGTVLKDGNSIGEMLNKPPTAVSRASPTNLWNEKLVLMGIWTEAPPNVLEVASVVNGVAVLENGDCMPNTWLPKHDSQAQ